jgi:Flp pilus assembly protein TadD
MAMMSGAMMSGRHLRGPAGGLLLLMAACSAPQPRAVEVAPEVPLAQWTPSRHLADAAASAGAPAIALQVSDQLLAKNPRDADAWISRGDALAALGRSSEAATSYASAVEIKPRDTKALVGLGRARLQQDPGGAEAMFARAVTLDPHDAAAASDLGVARDLQGHHAAAQEAYRIALGITPSSVAVQVNLGLSLALSGDAPGAVRLLQPLATVPGATPRVRHDLALALALDGRRAEASTVLGADLPPEQVRGTLDGFEALRR